MKPFFYSMLLLVVGAGVASCKYDNYAAPQSALQGKIVYKGEPINVEFNNVTFELWEPGWQKKIPITVTVNQDGTYSALLFDATYKLFIPAAQGPFRTIQKDNSDTTLVNLKGSQTLDIEVLPYYMVRKPTFTASGRKVTGTCQLEKIITDANAKNVERVSLYVSKTQFVDTRTSIATKDLTGATALGDLSNLSLSVDVPTTTGQAYVFARIGVKIAGVEDLIFSPVQKIQF